MFGVTPLDLEDMILLGLRRWKVRASNSRRSYRIAFIIGVKETPARGVCRAALSHDTTGICMSARSFNLRANDSSLSVLTLTDRQYRQHSVAITYLLSERLHHLVTSVRYLLLQARSRKDIYPSPIAKKQHCNCFYRDRGIRQ